MDKFLFIATPTTAVAMSILARLAMERGDTEVAVGFSLVAITCVGLCVVYLKQCFFPASPPWQTGRTTMPRWFVKKEERIRLGLSQGREAKAALRTELDELHKFLEENQKMIDSIYDELEASGVKVQRA